MGVSFVIIVKIDNLRYISYVFAAYDTVAVTKRRDLLSKLLIL